MLIVMRHGAAEEEIQAVVAAIEEMGYQARPMPGKQRTTVGLVGNDGSRSPRSCGCRGDSPSVATRSS